MFYGVVEKNYDKKSKTEKISFGVKTIQFRNID